MKTIKNILVATDFSADSQKALEEAVILAEKFKSDVYITNVVANIDECVADYCISEEMLISTKEKLLTEARRKMNIMLENFEGMKHVNFIPDIRYGHVYDELLAEESDKKIDLVVIGPHQRKSFWERNTTHLSDRLANNTQCDTLLVHKAA